MNRSANLAEFQAITLDEAAGLLGISKRTLQRLINARKFPRPVKVGASTRIMVEDLRRYLESRRNGERS